jgi:hypothetical protein
MVANTTEELRHRYLELAEQMVEGVRKSYAPDFERYARYHHKLADLQRAFRRDCELATRDIVRKIAGLPPEGLIFENQPKSVD